MKLKLSAKFLRQILYIRSCQGGRGIQLAVDWMKINYSRQQHQVVGSNWQNRFKLNKQVQSQLLDQ